MGVSKASGWLLMACLCCLSACATTGESGKGVVSVEQLLKDSDAADKSGLQEKSLEFLNRAAKENPARKEPWLRKAQIYFESQDYGQAILASEEVLHLRRKRSDCQEHSGSKRFESVGQSAGSAT